jgi:hypothetical protein
MKINEFNAPVQPDSYEASMLIKQAIRAGKYSIQIHNLLDNDQEVEAWVQKKIDLATNYVKKIAKYLELEGQYGEDAGEGHMAKSQLFHSAKYAMQIAQTVRPGDDIEAWVQTKMNRAVDMLDAVYHYEDYQRLNPYREDLGDEHARHGAIIQKKIDEILAYETDIDDIETKPGMFNILKKRVNEFEKKMTKEKVDERMPASIIKRKQQLSYMSDKELADRFKDYDETTLRQMAWRHGYRKMSPYYWDRVQKGKTQTEDVNINEDPRAVGRALAILKYGKAMANAIKQGEDSVSLKSKADAYLGGVDQTLQMLDAMYSTNNESLDEGIKDWAKKIAAAGIIVGTLAGFGSINNAINNSVPAISAMNTAYEMAVDAGKTDLADEIKKDIRDAKLRLDTGKDLNHVKYLQDKYSKFMVNEYKMTPFKKKVMSKLKGPVDVMKQKRDQEAYRDKMQTLQNISKNKYTHLDPELKDKLAARLDKLRTTGM